ncbi:MAG: hypothetical protein BGN95_09520 [Sphingomonas sp. 66-10]|uniref:hypothetical protein n=1 Tax=Sphingomonas sp. 66-10 TaxID=1895848 RepID=UPI000929AA47|nr:hypothetical protein [Sphingomonas sp. 66-10]OJU22422.1 MAG: hypothetical protein BGN95_09520 [Sphingomonas sp. 66-10]
MTARDFAWRALGALLMIGSYAASALVPTAVARATALPGFAVAIAGLVLLVQGKRVALALRIERGRHRELPRAIHARHRIRRARL